MRVILIFLLASGADSYLTRAEVGSRDAPKAVVDLDLPPRDRWTHIAKRWKSDIVDAIVDWERILNTGDHVDIDRAAWLELLHSIIPKEYIEELEGIVQAIAPSAVTLDGLVLFNSMYELGSPMGCSEVIAAMPDGHVLHGRNLDYRVISPVVDVTFVRNGDPIVEAPIFLGQNAYHTLMRINGNRTWTFGQNTRFRGGVSLWLEDSLRRRNKVEVFQYLARRLTEQDLDFTGALSAFEQAELVRPQYFTLAGTGAYEGAIITRDASPVPDRITRLSNTKHGWYLVQTNDDQKKTPRDERRPWAIEQFERSNRTEHTNTKDLFNLMWTEPLFSRGGTVFTTVYDPRSIQSCDMLGLIAGGHPGDKCHLQPVPELKKSDNRWDLKVQENAPKPKIEHFGKYKGQLFYLPDPNNWHDSPSENDR